MSIITDWFFDNKLLSAFILFWTYFVLKIIELYKQRRKAQINLIGKSPIPIPETNNILFGHIEECTENKTVLNWHKYFGSVVGFFNSQRFQVRINDLALIEQVFIKQSKNFDERIRDYRMAKVIESILFNKGDRWKKIRRLVQPALHQYRIRRNSEIERANLNNTFVNNNLDNSKKTVDEQTHSKVHDLHRGLEKLLAHFDSLFQSANINIPIEQLKANSNNQLETGKLRIKVPNANDVKRGFYIVPTADNRSVALRVDVRTIMQSLTLDVMFRIGFNNNSVDVTKGGHDKCLEMSRTVVDCPNNWVYKTALAIPVTRLILVPYILLFDPNIKCLKKLNARLYENMDIAKHDNKSSVADNDGLKKSAAINQPKRISNILMEHLKNGSLSSSEFTCNTAALLIAGFETTATTATYLTWCLAKYPDLQEKLRAEIIEQGIQSDYLDMFIKETMRMFPALPNFVARTPYEDTTISGYEIKRGTVVYMSVIAVHYDPKIWPNPYKFDPERFAADKYIPQGAWAPFGMGHRKCAGMHLALHELKAIACALLKKYFIKLVAPDEMVVESLSVFLTRPKYDVKVDFVPLAFVNQSSRRSSDDSSASVIESNMINVNDLKNDELTFNNSNKLVMQTS